jgi:hypothetical protein
VGYQPNFEELTTGLFFFNHSCEGTLAIPVSAFRDLYEGPIWERRETGCDECPEFCLYKDELRPCPLACECAYVRDLILIIGNWRKR